MLQFSDLLPSKQLLDILEICPPKGYSKRATTSNCIVHSPVTLLGFLKMNEQYGGLPSMMNHLSQIFDSSEYANYDAKIFDMWFRTHLIDDGYILLNNFLKIKDSLFLINNFSDLANYVYLTNRKKVEQIDMSEWLINSPFIKIHNTAPETFNNIDTTLDIMSSNYSISEVINVMYMNYESHYKLFIDEDINVNSHINSVSLNNVVYQMLMIYYYYVLKEITRPDSNKCLRLKEFTDYDTRQLVYKNIYDLSFMGNPNMYQDLAGLDSDDVYHFMDDRIVAKFFLLVGSNVPVSEWLNLMPLPTEWIRSMVNYRE